MRLALTPSQLLKTSARLTHKDRADDHFERAVPDWSGFEKNLQRPGFRKAVKTHPYADEKLQRYVDNFGGYVGSQKVIGKVSSRTEPDKSYEIRKLPGGRLGCGCKDWQFKHSHRGTDCDHIEMARKSPLNKTAGAVLGAILRGMGGMNNFERGKKTSNEGLVARQQILRARGLLPPAH